MDWFIYLLKVSTCMGLFYVLYYLVLQKLTFFSFNRFYLLATLVLSFVIPLMQLELKTDGPSPLLANRTQVTAPAPAVPQRSLETFQAHTEIPPSSPSVQHTDWQEVLVKGYWAVAAIIFSALLIHVATLLWHSRKVTRIAGPLRIVNKSVGFTNCSFLHYVFVDQKELDPKTLAAIMHHEGVHAARYHSLDKLFIGLCRALLWFNPVIYGYSRALEQVHEYEADSATSDFVGHTVYANLLLSLAIGTSANHTPLVHSFVRNPVKERIKMLFTNPSKNMKKLTYLTLVPAGLALVWLFGVQVVYAESTNSENLKASLSKLAAQLVNPSKTMVPGPANEPVASKPNAVTEEKPEAPVRLVDDYMLGDNPQVTIDGKPYAAEILTRISPACISSGSFGTNKVALSTKNNRIEFATKAEIETAKIRRKITAQAKFYSRYPVTIDGRQKDEIQFRFGNSLTHSPFPKKYRIALLIGGEIYTEKQAMKMDGNIAYNMTGVNYLYAKDEPELFRKYGNQYDLILEFNDKKADSAVKVPVITVGSSMDIYESFNGKFEYIAKDSVSYSADKRYVTLFGNAVITNGARLTLSGDKIRFDAKTRTAIVQNAGLTIKGEKKDIKGNLLKVDIDHGTYEQLSGTPDF